MQEKKKIGVIHGIRVSQVKIDRIVFFFFHFSQMHHIMRVVIKNNSVLKINIDGHSMML